MKNKDNKETKKQIIKNAAVTEDGLNQLIQEIK